MTGLSLAALHQKYVSQYAGRALVKAMKKLGQGDDKKTGLRVDKAIKAALADLELLVQAMAPAPAEADEANSDAAPADASDDVPDDVSNDQLAREIYWRLHDGWAETSAPEIAMIDLAEGAPAWADVAAVLHELSLLDHDASDAESFPVSLYENLLTRFETRLGRDKPKKPRGKKAPARKAAAVIPVPTADTVFIPYSTKLTFEVGQWVRHPTFGDGYVTEVGQHVTLQFGPVTKLLAHVQAVAAPPTPKVRPIKPEGDTLELARAAGIDVQRLAARDE